MAVGELVRRQVTALDARKAAAMCWARCQGSDSSNGEALSFGSGGKPDIGGEGSGLSVDSGGRRAEEVSDLGLGVWTQMKA